MYWEEKKSMWEISRELNIPHTNLHRFMIENKIPRRDNLIHPNLKLNANMFYILGVIFGDGNPCIKNETP